MPFVRPSLLCIVALLVMFTSACMSQPLDSARANIFDLIRPSFEVMEFIAESQFVPEHTSLGGKLTSEFKELAIFPKFPAAGQSSDPKEELRFSSNDETTSITIFQRDNGDYLYEKWKTDLKAMGLKSDIRNDDGGSVFCKVKTTTNGAVGSLFYTGRNLFEIVIDLPFPVETVEALSDPDFLILRKKYETLYKILESIAKTYVVPEEFVLYPSKTLTREQRLYGLVQFWTEVKYNFAFFDHVPDLNWDHVLAIWLPIIEKEQTTEEYYKNLSRMCALLKDGHTNIYRPNQIEAAIASTPVQLMNIQNKAIVSNTDQSLNDQIPIGSEIITVDGMRTQDYLLQNILPFISSSTEHILFDNGIRTMLHGRSGTQVKIEYKTPAGKLSQRTLNRSSNQQVVWTIPSGRLKNFEFKRLPDKIAYVSINTFGNSKVVEEFENHIDSINSCDRLIIDLRSNGGGNSSNAYRIIEHLTSKPFSTSKWRTREHRAAFKAWGSFQVDNFRTAARSKNEKLSDWDKVAVEYYKGDHWYGESSQTIVPPVNKKIKIPVVVLIGHKTASAAEDFLVALENTERATTIGSKTFGSTGQPLSFKLPGGGSARICTKRDEYPDGRQFVGYGVKPDIEIENTVEDLINGRDAVLTRAMQVVKDLKK